MTERYSSVTVTPLSAALGECDGVTGPKGQSHFHTPRTTPSLSTKWEWGVTHEDIGNLAMRIAESAWLPASARRAAELCSMTELADAKIPGKPAAWN